MAMINEFFSVIRSPIGDISIFADDHYVNKITFKKIGPNDLEENEISNMAAGQLAAYFQGQLRSFSLPLQQPGTDFQQGVWNELTKINYGRTLSYLQLSKQLNNVLAIRAIAAANGKNDLAIVIPCHRVIGSNGTLVGYAGELWRKQWLLEHENEVSQQGQMTLKF
jgi:methylated-DNA-[protein]-cysteine S-methyltransferase